MKKKSALKNIKYWQRNGGFKFWPEVKITRLIDIFSDVFWNQLFFSFEADTKELKLREFVQFSASKFWQCG